MTWPPTHPEKIESEAGEVKGIKFFETATSQAKESLTTELKLAPGRMTRRALSLIFAQSPL